MIEQPISQHVFRIAQVSPVSSLLTQLTALSVFWFESSVLPVHTQCVVKKRIYQHADMRDVRGIK